MFRNFLTATLIASCVGLGGCATSVCGGFTALTASQRDTPETKKEILEHNEYGVAQGCWKRNE